MKLHTVTTIAPSGSYYGGTRLVAICESFERAESIVLKNVFDIYETSYQYAIIEEVNADEVYGAMNFDGARWYEWTGTWEAGKYVACPTPIEFLRIIGFFEAGPIRNALIELRTDDARFGEAFKQMTAEHWRNLAGELFVHTSALLTDDEVIRRAGRAMRQYLTGMKVK